MRCVGIAPLMPGWWVVGRPGGPVPALALTQYQERGSGRADVMTCVTIRLSNGQVDDVELEAEVDRLVWQPEGWPTQYRDPAKLPEPGRN